jgi:hypothetical protein
MCFWHQSLVRGKDKKSLINKKKRGEEEKERRGERGEREEREGENRKLYKKSMEPKTCFGHNKSISTQN